MVEFNEENFKKLVDGLLGFEEELVRRNTKYFGGMLGFHGIGVLVMGLPTRAR